MQFDWVIKCLYSVHHICCSQGTTFPCGSQLSTLYEMNVKSNIKWMFVTFSPVLRGLQSSRLFCSVKQTTRMSEVKALPVYPERLKTLLHFFEIAKEEKVNQDYCPVDPEVKVKLKMELHTNKMCRTRIEPTPKQSIEFNLAAFHYTALTDRQQHTDAMVKRSRGNPVTPKMRK